MAAGIGVLAVLPASAGAKERGQRETKATQRHPSGCRTWGPLRLLNGVFRFYHSHAWPWVLFCVLKPSTLVFSCPSSCISPCPVLNLITTFPALYTPCSVSHPIPLTEPRRGSGVPGVGGVRENTWIFRTSELCWVEVGGRSIRYSDPMLRGPLRAG